MNLKEAFKRIKFKHIVIAVITLGFISLFIQINLIIAKKHILERVVKKVFSQKKVLVKTYNGIFELKEEDKIDLSKAEAQEIISEDLQTYYHKIKLNRKPMKGYLPSWEVTKKRSGYIDFLSDEKLIMVSGDGKIFTIPASLKGKPKEIKSNLNKLKNANDIQGKNITGVLDILIPKKTLNNSILVSGYKKIKKDKPCYTLQIYKADLTDNFTSLDFQEFLTLPDCISKKISFLKNGGRIIELDNENLLLSVGDFLRPLLAQDDDRMFGKTLKINVKSRSFSVFTKGHRNPQGLYIDKKGTIFSSEHGPRGGDEINILKQGQNYGWPQASYGTQLNFIDQSDQWQLPHNIFGHANFTEPLYAFVGSIGASQIIKYEHTYFENWKNNLLVSSMGFKKPKDYAHYNSYDLGRSIFRLH